MSMQSFKAKIHVYMFAMLIETGVVSFNELVFALGYIAADTAKPIHSKQPHLYDVQKPMAVYHGPVLTHNAPALHQHRP